MPHNKLDGEQTDDALGALEAPCPGLEIPHSVLPGLVVELPTQPSEILGVGCLSN